MQWWRAALAALALAAAASAGGAGGAGGPGGLAARLSHPPRAARAARAGRAARAPVPLAMRALYAQLAAPEPLLPAAFLPRSPLQRRAANTVRSFTHEESVIDRRFKGDRKFRLVFNVTVPDDEWLKGAELVLTRDAVGGLAGGPAADHRHRVLVYDIVRPGKRGGPAPELRLQDARWVRLREGGTVSLDVSAAAERWLWRPALNHGLLVHVEAPPELAAHRHVRLRRGAGEGARAWRPRQPALLAFTDDGRARLAPPPPPAPAPAPAPSRPRRAPRRPHRRRDGRDACQRRPLFVDFADVGWSDWIVAPNGYDAFYCHGDCPFPLADHLNSTNHAIVQTLVNSVNPAAVPKACCVPTALSSISMLYLDEDNKVVLKNYQDMAVVGCGCR